jgi:hypothetical protein
MRLFGLAIGFVENTNTIIKDCVSITVEANRDGANI